jgi:hypothetical protein
VRTRESERELEREGRRCALFWGGVLAYYRGWGVPGRRWPGSNGRHYGITHHLWQGGVRGGGLRPGIQGWGH